MSSPSGFRLLFSAPFSSSLHILFSFSYLTLLVYLPSSPLTSPSLFSFIFLPVPPCTLPLIPHPLFFLFPFSMILKCMNHPLMQILLNCCLSASSSAFDVSSPVNHFFPFSLWLLLHGQTEINSGNIKEKINYGVFQPSSPIVV